MVENRQELWSICFETQGLPYPDQPRPYQIKAQEARPPYHTRRVAARRGFWIFKYTLAGRGRFWVGQEEYLLGPGEGFLCQGNDPRIRYECIDGDRDPWRFVFLTYWGANQLSRVVQEMAGPVFAVPPAHPMIRKLLQYRSIRRSVLPLGAAEGAELVNRVLWGLVALSESETGRSRLVQQARLLMRERLESTCSMQELARDLEVSLPHLSRTFKAETGVTLLAAFQQMKIEHACDLLTDTNLRINEIANHLGFSSASNFTRTFHRVTGCAPKTMRRSSQPARGSKI